MQAEVVELRSEAELREAFPTIRELHRDLDEQRYLELLDEMVPAGYRLFAVRESSGQIVAAAGVQAATAIEASKRPETIRNSLFFIIVILLPEKTPKVVIE